MSLRMKDFQCLKCGKITEEIVVVGDSTVIKHCGKTARELVGAPMVHYKPHYSHGLGRRVDTYAEEERGLAREKNGAWIASKTEANNLYDTDTFTDNVTVKRDRQAGIRKAAEKAAEKLTGSGAISLAD
jgi:hypothetical protein